MHECGFTSGSVVGEAGAWVGAGVGESASTTIAVAGGDDGAVVGGWAPVSCGDGSLGSGDGSGGGRSVPLVWIAAF